MKPAPPINDVAPLQVRPVDLPKALKDAGARVEAAVDRTRADLKLPGAVVAVLRCRARTRWEG